VDCNQLGRQLRFQRGTRTTEPAQLAGFENALTVTDADLQARIEFQVQHDGQRGLYLLAANATAELGSGLET
jgi:hypothetical protein